jgi:hypothetical protein
VREDEVDDARASLDVRSTRSASVLQPCCCSSPCASQRNFVAPYVRNGSPHALLKTACESPPSITTVG